MKKVVIIFVLFLVIEKARCPEIEKSIVIPKIDIEKLKEELRIEKLMLTIRIIESGDDYEKIGASGEYGAYQFMPSTWKFYCFMFYGKELDIRVIANQDDIAYKKIERLVKNGLNDAQIASFWNCGKPNGEDLAGINKFGVEYNVGAYVNKFINVLNQI